jgi:hypothetical protein
LSAGWRFSTASLFVLLWDFVFARRFEAKNMAPEAKENCPSSHPRVSIDRHFSLSSEATAEGKFGRVAGNIGIRCRQPAVGSGQPPSF